MREQNLRDGGVQNIVLWMSDEYIIYMLLHIVIAPGDPGITRRRWGGGGMGWRHI